MTTAEAVREQYEALPYPPRNPLHELRHLYAPALAELNLVASVCWGGRRPGEGFRALDAGCGTGDAAVFLAEQLRHCGGRVTALDLSEASLHIARERAERRGLENTEFVHGRIEDIAGLDVGPFDYVVSSGVLHHLPDPSEGLRALVSVLAPGGALAIMVYGEYGRTAIYQLQELFRVLAPPSMPTVERLDVVKRVLANLPPQHWANLGKSSWQPDVKLHGDAGLFDLFLHSQDRAYTVPELYAWLDDAGLELVRFDLPLLYEPTLYDASVRAGTGTRERQAVAELLSGRIKKHAFIAVPSGQEVPGGPEWDDLDAVPAWLVHDPAGILEQVDRRPSIAVSYEGAEYECTLDGFRRDFLRLVNGERQLGQILASVQEKRRLERTRALAEWQSLLQALQLFNLLGLLRG